MTGSINEREVVGDAEKEFAVFLSELVTYSVKAQFSEGWNETQSSNVFTFALMDLVPSNSMYYKYLTPKPAQCSL